MRLIPVADAVQIGKWSARYIAEKINTYQPSAENPFVLGLPTGSTPISTYKELINLFNNGIVSFKHVVTFNMDEYVGIDPQHPESYRSFMYREFFDHTDIQQENINLLDGLTDDVEAYCLRYEEKMRAYG